jgi:hypothetical protein
MTNALALALRRSLARVVLVVGLLGFVWAVVYLKTIYVGGLHPRLAAPAS